MSSAENSLRDGWWRPAEGEGSIPCPAEAGAMQGAGGGAGHAGCGPRGLSYCQNFQSSDPAAGRLKLALGHSKSVKNELIWETGKYLETKSHLGVNLDRVDVGAPAEKPLQKPDGEGQASSGVSIAPVV